MANEAFGEAEVRAYWRAFDAQFGNIWWAFSHNHVRAWEVAKLEAMAAGERAVEELRRGD